MVSVKLVIVCVCEIIAVMRDSSRSGTQLLGPAAERVRKVSAPNTQSLMLALLQNEARLARCVDCVAVSSSQ